MIFSGRDIFADGGEGNIGGNQSFPTQSGALVVVATLIRHLNLHLQEDIFFFFKYLVRIFEHLKCENVKFVCGKNYDLQDFPN